jgi:hypothetical protein
MSERRTDATASGSSGDWKTPRATLTPERPETVDARNAKQRVIYATDKSRRWGQTESLHSQVAREWATPRRSENEQRTRKHQPSVADGHGKMLAAQVLEWPTPTWKDHAQSGSGTTLTDATARDWPTATQRDWKDGACRDANVPTNGLLGRAVPRTTGSSRARLNPRWVAQLMGYPHDWLAPDGGKS